MPDLVGHVAVGGHSVAADDDGVDLADGYQPRGGRVDAPVRCGIPSRAAPRWSAGLPGAAGVTRCQHPSSSPRWPARRSRPAPCPGPARPARRCCSGSAPALAPTQKSAPLAAIASLAAASSAWMARAAARAAARRSLGPDRQRGVTDPIDRPGQIDRRRPGGAQMSAARLQRVGTGNARELEREPVRRGDADQRRAPDRQAHDRAGRPRPHCAMRASPRAMATGLVERPQGAVLETERFKSRRRWPRPMLIPRSWGPRARRRASNRGAPAGRLNL